MPEDTVPRVSDLETIRFSPPDRECNKHGLEQLEWTGQGKHISILETAIARLERYTKALTPIWHLQLSQIVMTVIQIEEHSSDLDMVMRMSEAAPLLAVRHHPV